MTQDARGNTETAVGAGWGARQSRELTWHDPMTTQASVASMSGLAYWQAVVAAELPPPPIGELMRMSAVEVDHGRIAFACTPDGSMYNPLGVVHGGVMCTLLDTVTGCALHTTLPVGVAYTSIEIKVNYLSPVTVSSGPVTAVGTVVKAGSRVGFAEAKAVDANGKLVATATSTLLIFETPGHAKPSGSNGNNP
ncbi:PaaI family thioesterase [Mycobacterium parmense]|uniref:Aromatic compound degradation protein PaaI n=1 Tax=Mycobacterium parmense TaxID=185642 RepID=A0A7I7YZ13_9MYCO|nr:PaaI family thioesterase [Mycobacterium parmense]MCV7352897.1 PaaI family thioesterase [Mycobacterium parmense]ORW55485.1 aromatic compound degradation protein PaaI [Mycobacterium parmense]BBZ46909.1 aromatic compound degradation protein PaaI [Mycobacterium parmense]